MIYKNLSTATKTFYGVTFKPGEEHDVPGCIHYNGFMRLKSFSSAPKKLSEATKKHTVSKTTSKKEVTSDGSDQNQ